MKEYYFPKEIWNIITLFLGENYWEKRNHLTNLSQALDLKYSNYANHSYWKWFSWRKREMNNWYLNDIELMKPILPKRLKNYITNPYIISIEPPLLNMNSHLLCDDHIKARKIVFNYIK